MYINKVISYMGAWETLNKENPQELQDIKEALLEFHQSTHLVKVTSILHFLFDKRKHSLDLIKKSADSQELFYKVLGKKGWQEPVKVFQADSMNHNYLYTAGALKKQICIANRNTSIGNWLLGGAALIIKHGFAKIPILLSPSCTNPRDYRRFEIQLFELQNLSPFNHSHPF